MLNGRAIRRNDGRWYVERVLELRGRPTVASTVMEPPDPEVGIFRPRALQLYAIDPDGCLVDLDPREQAEVIEQLGELLPEEG